MFKTNYLALVAFSLISSTALAMTLPAAQDVSVQRGSFSTTSYPHADSLMVKQSPHEGDSRHSLLKFRPKDFSKERKGMLNLHQAHSRAAQLGIGEVDNSWEDTWVSWETQTETEDAETAFFRIDAPQLNQWARVDITNLLAGRQLPGSLHIRNGNKAMVLINH